MPERDDDSDDDDVEAPREAPREQRGTRFQRLGEQLTGLLDPEAAFRRGQDLVTGVTQATKDELMRIVGAEVRSFLDKMDVADLAQQVIAGLVVDVEMQIRFSKDASGRTQPEVTRGDARLRTAGRAKEREGSRPRGKDEPEEE